MNFSVNLQKELESSREKHRKLQQSLMDQVNKALQKGIRADEYLLKRLQSAPKPGSWEADRDKLDKNRIFSIDDIKEVCIRYRLRFLDSRYFKMELLPYEALNVIKELEQQNGSEIKKTGIAAASGYFKLQDSHKDPILFAQLDERNYYMVYKWGKDLAIYKKWLAYPLRSILSLFITIVSAGVPAAMILPYLLWHSKPEIIYYQRLFLAALTMYTVFIMIFGGITFYKKFSRVCWNSPYFN